MFRRITLLVIFCLSIIPVFAQTASKKTSLKKEKKAISDSIQPVSKDTTKTPTRKRKKAIIKTKQAKSKQTKWVKDIMGLMEKEKMVDSIQAGSKDITKSPYEIMKEQKKEVISLLIMRPVSGYGVSKLKNEWLLYLCETYMHFRLGGIPALKIVSPDTLSILLTGYKDYKRAIPKERYKEVAGILSVPYLLYLQCQTAGKNVNFLGGISSIDDSRSFASISEQFPLKDLAATLDQYAIKIVEEMGIESAGQNRPFLDTPLASKKAKNLKTLGEFLSKVGKVNKVDKILWGNFIKKYNNLLKKDPQMLVGHYAAMEFCDAAEKYKEAAGYSHDLVHKLGLKYPPAYLSTTRFYRLVKKYDVAVRVADLAKNLKEIQKPLQEEIALCEKEREIEEARAAEEARKAEEAREAEVARRVEEARKAKEARQAESERRIEEARKAAEARSAESGRRVEEARKAKEERRAEEARRAEEERKAEEARIAGKKEPVTPAVQPVVAVVKKPPVTPAVYPKASTEGETKKSPMIRKGKKLVLQRKYKEAIDIFLKVIEDGKATSEMLFWMFRAYSLSGNIEEGERAFLDNIIDPNSLWSFIIQGEIDESRSFFSEAWKKYNKVLEKDLDNQYAISGIGRIELLRSNYESALEYFSKAFAFNANNMEYLFYMGKCYEGMNQDESALGIYEEVLGNIPDFPEALEGAERISRKLGLQSKAEQERIAKEEARREEEERKAEEAGKMEEAKRAEQERIAEEKALKAEEERSAEEAGKAEEAKKAEEERIAKERALIAEEERKAEEARELEEAEMAETAEAEDEIESVLQQDTVSLADELKNLAKLRDAGVISEEDFMEFKKQLLSQ